VAAPPERGGSAFVPVKLLELDAASAPPPSDVVAKPARQTRRGARRGAMEISLPNGAKVSLDAEALRRVLSALGVRSCKRMVSRPPDTTASRQGSY
jgi:transposase